MVASDLTEAIVATFLRPTVDRLSEEIGRAISLEIIIKIDGEFGEQSLISTVSNNLTQLSGQVRTIASDTAVLDRYKYTLQCLFAHDETLHGFSGFQPRSAVTLRGSGPVDGNEGFSYMYNVWSWGPKLRDF